VIAFPPRKERPAVDLDAAVPHPQVAELARYGMAGRTGQHLVSRVWNGD